MRRLVYGMNVSLDGFITAPGDDHDWSAPSDELFRWWLEAERAVTLFLSGRRLWETMHAYWPTGDQVPGASADEIAFAVNWRETPKVVFSSTLTAVEGNARLHPGDAVAEIARLKRGEGGRMRVGGAVLTRYGTVRPGTAARRAPRPASPRDTPADICPDTPETDAAPRRVAEDLRRCVRRLRSPAGYGGRPSGPGQAVGSPRTAAMKSR